MAFTATILSISPQSDGSTGVTYLVTVNFTDSASGFTTTKTYSLPVNTTQASAVSTITSDGTAMKSALSAAGNLTGKVGSIIVI